MALSEKQQAWIDKVKAYKDENGCSYKEALTALGKAKPKAKVKKIPKAKTEEIPEPVIKVKKSKPIPIPKKSIMK
jgi:hypothetical protein